MYKYQRLVTPGLLAENCYLFWCPVTLTAVLIDPGSGAEEILRFVSELPGTSDEHETKRLMQIKMILLTHGHHDHVGAAEALRKHWGVPLAMHKGDVGLLKNLQPPEHFLEDGEVILVGEESLQVLHTPGHTPGSVCFYAPGVLFSGDTLFYRDVGRTDLPGGNYLQLITSIRDQLFVLPEETKVFPGHDESSEIGGEKAYNPYFHGR